MKYPTPQLSNNTPTKQKPAGAKSGTLTKCQINQAIVLNAIKQSPIKDGKVKLIPYNSTIGMSKATYHRHAKTLLANGGQIPRHPVRIAPAPKRDVIRRVLEDCDSIDIDTALKHCESLLKTSISTSYFYKVLDREGWSNKNCSRLARSNDPDACKQRYKGAKQYKRNVKKWVKAGKEIIHMDECTFDRGFIQGRKRRWSRRGTRAYQPGNFKFRGPAVNLITFWGDQGYHKSFIQESRLDMKNFYGYLMEVLTEIELQGRDVVLCLDGCPAHDIEALDLACSIYPNFEYYFFPPYTPVINACEYFFNQIKTHIRHISHQLPHMTPKEWRLWVQSQLPLIVVDTTTTFDHCLAYAYQLIAARGDLHKTSRAASAIVSELSQGDIEEDVDETTC